MTENATPTAAIGMVSIDCDDAATMATFYSAVLGWPIAYQGDGYAMLQQDGRRLGFGQTPDYRRPSWPDDGHKQFHLDLAATDVEATAARCVELGATRPEEQPGGDRWTVLLDPAGHPFCITDLANWG
ncbi:VOC family protein [Flexivirga caeni]|uniref:VOC family protein n=1 Tax=Flexivirga caeni TaxID=2294115 RepID=A0A3M9MBX5_9MICO|nr:VOC family protein [Flexivirga caeni]RNI23046.1 VOC family protein [Flexivirga caeni]